MRRSAVFLAAAGLGFGVLIGGPGGAPPAQSALAATTVTGWSTTPVSATVGYALPVPVRVRTGAAYVTRTVVVQRRQAGVAAWTQVATKQTATSGHVTVALTAPAVGAWDFRLVVPATATAAAASTTPRRVTGVTGLATTISGWPTAPVAVQPGAFVSAQVLVQTGTGYGARKVQIQRRATTGTAWTTVVDGATASNGLYQARFGAPEGAWYFRVVVPVSQTARPAQSGMWPVTVRDTVAPGPVTGLAVTARTRTSISLKWTNPLDADMAAVIVRRALGATPPASVTAGTAVTLPSPKATGVLDRELAPGTRYSYAVFTRDTHGNTRTPGATVSGQTWPAMRLATVDAGAMHTCGLGPAGKAWCWGEDESGQLGDGADDGADEFVPVAVAGGRTYGVISAGFSHTCALTASGQAWCWGDDSVGELGDGDDGQAREDVPVAVAGGHTFIALAAGAGYTCGLDSSGVAWCWGGDFYGALGDGDDGQGDEYAPVAVAGDHTFGEISAGFDHTCAVKWSGEAWCWGTDDMAQLGDGDDGEAPEYAPVPVAGGHSFHSIAAGGSHTCALASDNKAWCWGSDNYGQVGDGGEAQGLRFQPTLVAGGRSFSTVSAAAAGVHTCALDLTGKAWCWGRDEEGQLGDGNGPSLATAPVAVAGGHTMTAISVDWAQTCAVDSSTNAWCWGDDEWGQIGDGNDGQADEFAPVPVAPGVVP